MVQLNYDFSQTAPSSGGGRMFPPSDANGWLVQIEGEEVKAMTKGQGTRLVLKLRGLEGAVAGQGAENGYNVDHPNGETVRIAYQELAAVGWACGALKHGALFVGDTSIFFGKPFRVIVAPQTQNPQYNEIVGYRTPDGQDPAKLFNGTANGPTHGANPGQNIGGGNPNPGQGGGGFNGGGGAPQGGGFNGGGNPPQGQGQPGGQQGGFGGAPQGGNAGWGQNGGQGQGQPQGGNQGGNQGNAGWGQNGGNQGGNQGGGNGGGWGGGAPNNGGGQNSGGWG